MCNQAFRTYMQPFHKGTLFYVLGDKDEACSSHNPGWGKTLAAVCTLQCAWTLSTDILRWRHSEHILPFSWDIPPCDLKDLCIVVFLSSLEPEARGSRHRLGHGMMALSSQLASCCHKSSTAVLLHSTLSFLMA